MVHQPPPALAPDLKQRLERKATCEAAIKELTAAVAAAGAAAAHTPLPELATLVPRVHALLKARYSNPSMWRAGLELFRAVQASGAAPEGLAGKLPAYIADAQAFVSDALAAEDADEQQQQQQQTLGELLLGLPPRAPGHSHLSDAGLVLDEPAPQQQRHMAAAAAAAAGLSEAGGDAAAPPAAGAPAAGAPPAAAEQEQQQHASVLDILRQLAQQQQQHAAGDGAPLPEDLLLNESTREELEAMLISMVEQHTAGQAGGGSSRPAASRATVARLPVVSLESAADLEAVGGPATTCPVCTEQLALGDKVQLLPCKHPFHVPCLEPWLQQDNSCPVCRQELPTDDHAYEARKERQAEEEEERRGAANALSHNEFAYI